MRRTAAWSCPGPRTLRPLPANHREPSHAIATERLIKCRDRVPDCSWETTAEECDPSSPLHLLPLWIFFHTATLDVPRCSKLRACLHMGTVPSTSGILVTIFVSNTSPQDSMCTCVGVCVCMYLFNRHPANPPVHPDRGTPDGPVPNPGGDAGDAHVPVLHPPRAPIHPLRPGPPPTALTPGVPRRDPQWSLNLFRAVFAHNVVQILPSPFFYLDLFTSPLPPVASPRQYSPPQVHTTGMDIAQPATAVAALTLSKDTTLRDYAQALALHASFAFQFFVF